MPFKAAIVRSVNELHGSPDPMRWFYINLMGHVYHMLLFRTKIKGCFCGEILLIKEHEAL